MPEPHTTPENARAAFDDCDSLAELMRMAVADGRQLDADTHMPDHSRWHEPEVVNGKPGNTCFVSYAGAVIASRFGADIYETLTPWDFGRETAARLDAIDCVARGRNHIPGAYSVLEQEGRASAAHDRWRGTDAPEQAHLMAADYIGRDDFMRHLDAVEALADEIEAFERDHPINH